MLDTSSTSNNEKCSEVKKSNPETPKLEQSVTDDLVTDKAGLRDRPEGVFQVPSKPIDINLPSSSQHNRPPQRSDSETSSIHMEVDEASGYGDKAGANTDIDSGIENMEVGYVLISNYFC